MASSPTFVSRPTIVMAAVVFSLVVGAAPSVGAHGALADEQRPTETDQDTDEEPRDRPCEMLVIHQPDRTSGDPSAVAITSQVLRHGEPGWAAVGWEAAGNVTVEAVEVVRTEGTEWLDDGDLASGRVEHVLELRFCGHLVDPEDEGGAPGGGEDAEDAPEAGGDDGADDAPEAGDGDSTETPEPDDGDDAETPESDDGSDADGAADDGDDPGEGTAEGNPDEDPPAERADEDDEVEVLGMQLTADDPDAEGTLPRTGSSLVPVAMIAALAFVGGAGLLTATRRRRATGTLD